MKTKNKSRGPQRSFFSELAFHPFFFSAYFILFFLAHNLGEMSVSDITSPLAVVLMAAPLMVGILRFLFRSWIKASIFYSLFLVLFFSYGHLFRVVDGWEIAGFEIGRQRYLSLCFLLILMASFWILKKTSRKGWGLNYFLNVAATGLLLITLFKIGTHDYRASHWMKEQILSIDGLPSPVSESPPRDLPDIYYLILDGYGREDVLWGTYGFDNSDFVDELRKLGFYVADKSRSNYASTFLSLASSLNMKHLLPLADRIGASTKGRKIPEVVYQKNNVLQFLQEWGYKTIQFASRWGPTNVNPYVDVLHKKYVAFSSEFLSALVGSTWLQPLSLRALEMDARKQILFTFEELKKIPDDPEPTFVFAHILIPHTPLFDKEGGPLHLSSFVMRDQRVNEERMEDYFEQIQYMNPKILEIVTTLLKRSAIPPIIILQADHGPPRSESVTSAVAIEMEMRMGIMNAYYLPSLEARQALYGTITPVNTFRLILNHFFDADLDYLPDQSYYSSYEYPYRLIPVSDEVTEKTGKGPQISI